MIERGSGPRFAQKPLTVGCTQGQIVREKFQRDEALKLQILRFVDDPHAASTELFGDAIMRNGFADHGNWGADSRCSHRASQRAQGNFSA